MVDERTLVESVVAGDVAAEERFFKIYRPRLVRASAYFLGWQDSETEDIVQETFMVALPKLKDYVFEAPIYAWLRQICLRLCYARLRERNRTLTTLEDELEFHLRGLAAERVRSADADAHQQVRLTLLGDLITRLNPDSRQIIELRSLRGLSYAEIQRALGIPLGTVMSRLARARDQMRALLKSGAIASRPPPP